MQRKSVFSAKAEERAAHAVAKKPAKKVGGVVKKVGGAKRAPAKKKAK